MTYDLVKDLLAKFFDNQLERLELLWKSGFKTPQVFASRSLVLMNPKPIWRGITGYACFCFDHLAERRYTLLSLPEVYQTIACTGVEYIPYNGGRIPTYLFHSNTERIGKFLNRMIADASDLTKEIVNFSGVWSLEVYLHNKSDYYLDQYLLAGFPYAGVAKKLPNHFSFSDYPSYVDAKGFDGRTIAHAVEAKRKFDVQEHLRSFMFGKLSRLRLTWKLTETSESQDTVCYNTHILLLHDQGKYLMLHLNDQRRELHYLVSKAAAAVEGEKSRKVVFKGVGHEPPFVHDDLLQIKEALTLLLPNIAAPEGIFAVFGQFAHRCEWNDGTKNATYDEIKSLYFD